ncbi:MAG: hypothetical protein JRI23_09135 [Deltaproteobacteria bacterium]|jgi:hypothetical protein|nr:hypothetical protein [Deltaproteobacteria bacterium]MBW2531802.1 hypothetical protein [Deltaproteobacteria bacterium]
MTEPVEPARLFEAPDAPAELRALLDQAHGDVIGADAVGRIAAGVQAQVGGSSTPADGSGSPPTGEGGAVPEPSTGASLASGSSASKIGTAVVVAALAGGGLWWAADRGGDGEDLAIPSATTATAIASVEPTAEPLDPPAPETTAAEQSPPPARIVSAPAPRAGGVPTSAVDTADPPKQSTADVVEEHKLLRAARARLADDPRGAYALTQEHKRRFPRGMLAQEREVIAIEALSRMGKDDAAQSRADRFGDAYPDSPHRDRVQGAASGKGGARP